MYDKKGNKHSDFGKTWGAMKKDKANASFMQTGNGMYVIDIDSKKIPKKYKKWVQSLGHPTVETARGYHYYVKSKFKMKTQQNIFKDPDFKVDIRGEGGLIFTDYWGDDKRISYIKTGKNLKDEKFKITGSLPDEVVTQREKKKDVERGDVGQMSKKEVKRLVSKLDIKEYTDRDSWMRMLASIYHAGGSEVKKIAMKWSKGDSEQFDEGSFDQVWSQLELDKYGEDISAGTLIHASQGEKLPEPTSLFKKEEGSVRPLTKKEKKKKKKEEKKKKKEYDLLRIEGVMDDKELARQANEVTLFEGLMAEGYHTILYGASGSNKTTISAWACVEMLKEHKDKIVQFWAFDSDRIHNNEIYKYIRENNMTDRFLLIVNNTAQGFKDHYEMAIENKTDMSDVVIVIDTYKFVTDDVNNKNANKNILHKIKALQNLGATILTLAHSNKDGANFSGTAELSQDTDALMIIHREKDDTTGDVTTTIKTSTRARFGVPTGGITLMSNGNGVVGGDYHAKVLRNITKIENKFDGGDSDVFEEAKKKKEEVAKKLKLKEYDDKKYIDELVRIIDDLNRVTGRALTTTIIADAKSQEGMSKNLVTRLLRDYDSKYWKSKVFRHSKKGKSTKRYKSVK